MHKKTPQKHSISEIYYVCINFYCPPIHKYSLEKKLNIYPSMNAII